MKSKKPRSSWNSDDPGRNRVKFPIFLQNRSGKSGPGLGPGFVMGFERSRGLDVVSITPRHVQNGLKIE